MTAAEKALGKPQSIEEETFGPLPVDKWGSVLLEAQYLVHGDRQAAYGHPFSDFSRTAAMWSAILGFPVTAEQVGLCMIAVKLSRLCNSMKRDSLVDIAGYAETVQMVADEREARQELERAT